MDKPFSRKQLMATLMSRGVAPTYAWRAASELADHANDLAEGGLGQRAHLGHPDELADRIVDAYRQRTFAGRHPLLTFAVAPLPLIALAWIGYWFMGLALILAGSKFTNVAGLISLVIQYGSTFLPAMCLTGWICRLARQAGLSWRRTAVACFPVVLFTFIVQTRIALNGYAHGTFMFGFCLPLGRWIGPAFGPVSWWPPISMILSQVLSAALPAFLILLLYVRERRQSRSIMLDDDGSAPVDRPLKQVA